MATADILPHVMDVQTGRPIQRNDQYSSMSQLQISNVKQNSDPFFKGDFKCVEHGRFVRDRFTQITNKHNLRGASAHTLGVIDTQWSRYPHPGYDSCRGRASVRWGANKQGERTRSHFFGESHDRYTNIDMYRRNPTCYAGRVVMDCGRPGDGYYGMKYPSNTTWFGSSCPMNRTTVMELTHRKPEVEYKVIRAAEMLAREARQRDSYPQYSEYTDKFVMQNKETRSNCALERNRKHVIEGRQAQTNNQLVPEAR